MKQPINDLKQYFRTKKKPTQQQFWDWLDSFFHKDDPIPLGKVGGLAEVLDAKADKAYIDAVTAGFFPKQYLLNGDGSIPIPAYTMVEIIDISMLAPASIYIETVAGEQDILTYDADLPFTERTINPLLKCTAATSLSFGGGVPPGTKVLIYLKSLIPQA